LVWFLNQITVAGVTPGLPNGVSLSASRSRLIWLYKAENRLETQM
jgi:hypothetical protein